MILKPRTGSPNAEFPLPFDEHPGTTNSPLHSVRKFHTESTKKQTFINRKNKLR